MKISMVKIKTHMIKYVRRRSFRLAVEAILKKIRKSVKTIKRVVRWRQRHRKVLIEI